MVSLYMFYEVRSLIDEGLSNSEISRRLKIDRKTISKYRRSNTPPKYSPRLKRTRMDPLEGYWERVQFFHRSCKEITAAEMYLLIKKEGYSGSERTLQRRFAKFGRDEKKERFFEQVYEAGEQSQFDFKEKLEIMFIDGPRICNIHFGTLPFSGHFNLKAFPNKTYEAFIDGCHSFFEIIGGLTDKIRIDNLSPCVKKVLKGNERLYTDQFKKAINYYGFKVSPCAPGKGSDKGDVEREIRTRIRQVQNLIKLTGTIFRDYDDFNDFLSRFCIDHQTETIKRLLTTEKERLKPLPERDATILSHLADASISGHGMARIERLKASYSVPDEAIKSKCQVQVSAYEVKIFRGAELVVIHPRKKDGENSILLHHVLPSLVRKPQAMVRWSHRHILFPSPVFEKYYRLLKRKDDYAAERVFLRTINLIQYTTLSELAIAIELVIDADLMEDPFEEIKRLVTNGGHCPNDSNKITQPKISPSLNLYDLLIPNPKENKAS